MKKILFGIIISTSFSACKYDKETVEPIIDNGGNKDEREPVVVDSTIISTPCDSVDASFSIDILPLINNKCSPCHTENSFGGHKWTVYDEVKADKNLILSAINHEPSTLNMPQGKDKLPDEEIKLVQCWIENGALDN